MPKLFNFPPLASEWSKYCAFVITSSLTIGSCEHVLAQITPDETLGSERSRVTRDVSVRRRRGDRIDGGASRGRNLFHSFSEFNVDEAQRVYFANPRGIENILSRVTGDDISDIMGTLGVDGNANLFFLNPNGIIFGENARLDISGSFMATTADYFEFADGSTFSAVNPEGPPLLTLGITPGLQYGANSGAIQNQGQLSVGQDLTIAAGQITDSGSLTTQFGNLILEAVEGDLVLGGAYQASRDTTVQAANRLEITEATLLTDGALLMIGNTEIAITNRSLLSERDMVFRAPVRFLGTGNTFTTGGYFITETLDGTVVDFLVPHNQLIVSLGDVQFTQDYEGQSL